MPLIRRIRRLRRKRKHQHQHHHHKMEREDTADFTGDYDENMKQQIWYYILRKYFYEQMFGGSQPDHDKTLRTSQSRSGIYEQMFGTQAKTDQQRYYEQMLGTSQSKTGFYEQMLGTSQSKTGFYEQMLGSQMKFDPVQIQQMLGSQTNIEKTRSVDSEMTDKTQVTEKTKKSSSESDHSLSPKRFAEKRNEPAKSKEERESSEVPDFLKNMNIIADSSYMDYCEVPKGKVLQNPLTKVSSSSEDSTRTSSLNASESSALGAASTTSTKLAKREEYLTKLALYKRLKEEQQMKNNVGVNIIDDDEFEDDSSTEEIEQPTRKEPSWNTVVQMFDNFSLMKEMFSCGKKLF